MQIESNFPKYAGRVPPLDLSQVNNSSSANCRSETDIAHMWSSGSTANNSSNNNNACNTSASKMPSGGKSQLKVHSPSTIKRAAAVLQQHPYHRPASNCTPAQSYCSSTAAQTQLHADFDCDDLPVDPRDWTRAHVSKWLISMLVSEGLQVTPELTQKFPMNGKALCLMSLDMYLSRVPVGGKMLYRDFRVRLARAMALLN